jgi:hypothetical protein
MMQNKRLLALRLTNIASLSDYKFLIPLLVHCIVSY